MNKIFKSIICVIYSIFFNLFTGETYQFAKLFEYFLDLKTYYLKTGWANLITVNLATRFTQNLKTSHKIYDGTPAKLIHAFKHSEKQQVREIEGLKAKISSLEKENLKKKQRNHRA